jgi:hypothetical protein
MTAAMAILMAIRTTKRMSTLTVIIDTRIIIITTTI